MIEFIKFLIDFILHVDVHLDTLIKTYQSFTYFILFGIIFIETGLVIMPFLPGDSLLFAIGAFTARGAFSYYKITFLLILAAILGDFLNYTIGKKFGKKILNLKFFKKYETTHIQNSKDNFLKYGNKAVIISRFVPFLRTFTPFVAGLSEMPAKKFFLLSAIGGVIWIFLFISLGLFFGNLPFVKNNLKLLMVCIILFSVLPTGLKILKSSFKNSK